jgi:hypothetical protein
MLLRCFTLLVYALVDYHNLPAQVKSAGPESLGRSIDARIGSHYPDVQEIAIRLYGGWYGKQRLSRDGTKLPHDWVRRFRLSLAGASGKYCLLPR